MLIYLSKFLCALLLDVLATPQEYEASLSGPPSDDDESMLSITNGDREYMSKTDEARSYRTSGLRPEFHAPLTAVDNDG